MYFHVLKRLKNISMKTKFVCTKCGMCCKKLKPKSILIFPEDVLKISKKLNISPDEFLEKYCCLEYQRIENTTIKLFFLDTKYSDCPFLLKNECSIHNIKPIQCKNTPYNFFSYYKIWSYMPCISSDDYPEGCSIKQDEEYIKQILNHKYNFNTKE